MDACLYIGPNGNEWVWELFPGKSPGELTIAGKNWVRYMLDLCSGLNIGHVHIADTFFYEDLRNRFGNGSFWTTQIHFLPTSAALAPEDLLAMHRDTLPQDDVLFFWGQILPDLPDVRLMLNDPRPVERHPGEAVEDGVYLLRQGKLFRCDVPLLRMDSLQKYFQLNFRILNSPGMYTIPGYAPGHDNINFGENVIMMPNCRITPPAVIRGNSYLDRSVTLGGDVIIGEASLIENNSSLKHAIIMDHTWIGSNMAIENKIVCGSRVIDAESAEYVDLSDEFLAKSARTRRLTAYSAAEFLTALALTIGLAPLYCVALALKPWAGKREFFRFLLLVYPKCPQVLSGRAQLVRLGISDRACAFHFADAHLLLRDQHLREMADVYYFHHKSVRLMLAVVVLSLVKRLFVGRITDEQRSEAQ